jgi:hypothetical protein
MPEQPGLALHTSSSRTMQESIALYAYQHLFIDDIYNNEWKSCLDIFHAFDWSHDNEVLSDLFGRLDNGKLNLIYESSMRKHQKLVQLFESMCVEERNLEASKA